MRRVFCFQLTAIFLAAGLCAQAAVLLSENFDYPDGSLITVSSGTWQTHSGNTPGQAQVVSGRALLDRTNSEDVHSRLIGEPYASSTNLTLYLGFTVRFTSLPTASGGYFCHFKNAGTSFRPKLFATTSGAASGRFRLGISNSENSPAALLGPDLSINTDYQVVVRYSINTATGTLWLDAGFETDPSVTAADAANPAPIVAIAFRQSSGIGGLQVDNLIVATSFSEVTGDAPPPPAAVPAFSLLNYNVKGNGAADWSTNSAQVQAIGHQMQHLDPDIITFQEIPRTNVWQMTNFVTAFRPGFYLAMNSGHDGYIQSVILSRYPITRSQKWLDGFDLKPFGYTNDNPFLDNFTRDLFEAEISVPGFAVPLHVFTVHLKSGQNTDSSSKRAAEANAISNFFVTTFLPNNAGHPYVLTGDMNEDIARPPASAPQTVERLTGASTGLRLTTPRNPFSNGEVTWSIQSGLNKRYDYILPGGVLFSNRVSSQVFRSDLLPTTPPPLMGNDSMRASDHLPLIMFFSNPFDTPFRLLSASVSNAQVSLLWESTPGAAYEVEAGSSLTTWSRVASNLQAVATNTGVTLPATNGTQFFRIRRVP